MLAQGPLPSVTVTATVVRASLADRVEQGRGKRHRDALDAWPRPSGTSQPKTWIAIT